MRTLPWCVLLCAGCAETLDTDEALNALSDIGEVDLNVIDDAELDSGYRVDDEAPDANIDRLRGPQAPPVALTGEAWDREWGAEVHFQLTSDTDGLLLDGMPQEDGTWEWSGWLSDGEHMIRLVVEDPSGNMTAAERVIEVDWPNNAPECGISLPLDGDVYAASESVEMEAWAEDADGEDVVLYWSSDIQGALFAGESWSARLDVGEHVLTVLGDDGMGGSCTDSVQVTVR